MASPEISVEEFSKILASESQTVLLDVRTPEEFAIVSFPGATLIPLQEFHARREELETFAGKEVICYCHHGVRSLRAALFLEGLGVRAKSLAGGIDRYAHAIDPKMPRY